MKIFKLIFLFLIKFSSGEFSRDSHIMIKDFLDHLEMPSIVTAMVCWPEEISFRFFKTLNMFDEHFKKFYMVNIVEVDIEYFPRDENAHMNVIVVDLSCENTKELLKEVSHSLYYRFKWIVLDTDPSSMSSTFSHLPALPSSEIFVMQEVTGGFQINQIYRTCMESPLIEENFGKWFSDNRTILDLRVIKITSRRRKNLQKARLKASLVLTNNDSRNHLTDYRDSHIDTISKVNYHLTNYLVSFLNASIEYSTVSTWGYKDNLTNEWSGMIGELVTKKADLGASPLFFTTDRIPIIQYLAMTSPTRSKFVFRSPKLSYTDNVFVLPFDDVVWVCLGVLVVILTVVLFLAIYIEYRTNLVEIDQKDVSILRPKLYETFFVIFCAICQQGSAQLPLCFPSRFIAFLSFIGLMFLYASYSANIVALLQSPSTKIKTLEDLYNSRLKFGVDDTVFNQYYFSHATEPTRRKIFENKVMNRDGSQNFMNLTEGVEKIREGLFAFHMELGVGYKIIVDTFQEDEKCGLQEIQYLQVIDPFYAVQKNSSYSEMFKIGLIRLYEIGLQDNENSRLYTKRPKCSGGGAKFISVGLVDIEPAMYFICFGFTACGLIFVAELFLSFITQKIRSRKNSRKLFKMLIFK